MEVREEYPIANSGYSIAMHIWERGNVGMAELRTKLVTSMKQALLDMLMELYILQLPAATLSEQEVDLLLSPSLRRHPPPPAPPTASGNESFTSFEEVDIDTARHTPTLDRLKEELMDESPLTSTPSKTEQNWEEIERQRRRQSNRDSLLQQAMMGQLGTMVADYLPTILHDLQRGKELATHSVHHSNWSIPCGYVVETLLTQITSLLQQHLPALTFSTFKEGPSGYSHVSLDAKPATAAAVTAHSYALLGRDLHSWKEMQNPGDPSRQVKKLWRNQQLHHPLNSWRELEDEEEGVVPLVAVATRHSTFVPRQMMALVTLSNRQVSFQHV